MTNGKADEGKTPTEGFLARIKELAWLGTAVAAIVTAVWAATTYLKLSFDELPMANLWDELVKKYADTHDRHSAL